MAAVSHLSAYTRLVARLSWPPRMVRQVSAHRALAPGVSRRAAQALPSMGTQWVGWSRMLCPARPDPSHSRTAATSRADTRLSRSRDSSTSTCSQPEASTGSRDQLSTNHSSPGGRGWAGSATPWGRCRSRPAPAPRAAAPRGRGPAGASCRPARTAAGPAAGQPVPAGSRAAPPSWARTAAAPAPGWRGCPRRSSCWGGAAGASWSSS